ncbi:hypothetical protein L0B53_19310 (plasmid) [Vibrio sp. SS-MA-C1-2]|uniref:hypothetical protein n=1 Tax=Vibrio sp. SS-MA-C1-2 TaxID=2908646 RepID=UPI001F46CA9D|nr:hypothetical protein [Vibrio sp. SS-MA-C1-2]UJF20284.1 hypothetical protein L0B53_19310 [Vibrio sp. SS-MA-C1-2]
MTNILHDIAHQSPELAKEIKSIRDNMESAPDLALIKARKALELIVNVILSLSW